MNAPSFLPVVLSLLMLAAAVYSLWRLAMARVLERATDVEADLLHLAAGLAAAGLVSSWARTLPRDLWAVLFAAAAVYFAYRAWEVWDERRTRLVPAARAGLCGVFVYAFLAGVAPSTLQGSTAGQYTMAGMPGMIKDQTIALPALGLILVVALAFYAVAVVAQLSPEPGTETGGGAAAAAAAGGASGKGAKAAGTRTAGAKAVGTKTVGTKIVGTKAAGTKAAGTKAAGARPAGGADKAAAAMLAPRSVEICRIVLVLVLAYAILSKLV